MQDHQYEKKIYHFSIPEYIAFYPGLSADDLKVWWLIKSLDNDEHHCHASLETMAAMIERPVTMIRRALTNLHKKKLILNLSRRHKKRCITIPGDLAETLEWVIDKRRQSIQATRQQLRKAQEKNERQKRSK